jgi:RNA recognition motif 2
VSRSFTLPALIFLPAGMSGCAFLVAKEDLAAETGPPSLAGSDLLVPYIVYPPEVSFMSANAPSANPSPGRNQLNLSLIEDGQDTRTTVMIKNIPNKMSDRDLLRYIEKVCPRAIDFLYLRMDFRNGECLFCAAFALFFVFGVRTCTHAALLVSGNTQRAV